MLRLTSALTVSGLALALALASQPTSQMLGTSVSLVPVAEKCKNLYVVEPILVVDVSGGTLLGPYHTRFSVYNNGFASASKKIENLVFGGDDIDADTTYVSPAEVDALLKALEDAGAYKLCDQQIQVADIPLTTVTALRGKTDDAAHTFSYWVGFGSHSQVSTVISDFRNTHFPGF